MSFLLIDAAYAEFVTDPGFETGNDLVEDENNTIVLRTFSKIHDLARLRIGWGYCPPDIADMIQRIGPYRKPQPE